MKKILTLIILLLQFSLFAQWSNNPMVCSQLSDLPGEQALAKVATCNDGSTYISWFSIENSNYSVRLQRFDVTGVPQFGMNGMVVSNHTSDTWLTDYDLTVDQESNAIVTFWDLRTGSTNVFAYKISSNGSFLWGPDGVAISSGTDFTPDPKVKVTTSGNAIFAYESDGTTSVIKMQKLSPGGVPLWGTGITLQSATQKYTRPWLMASENDQMILVWYKETGNFPAVTKHIYAQKFDVNGLPLWPSDVVVSNAGAIPIYGTIKLESDDAGGVFVSWFDDRNGDNILSSFVQHITYGGTVVFQANGVECSTNLARFHLNPRMAYLPASDELMVFMEEKNGNQDQFGISAQLISPSGQRLWTDYGVNLVNLSAYQTTILRAQRGLYNGICFFFDYSFGPTNYADSKIAAILVDSTGNPVWTPPVAYLNTWQTSKLQMETGGFNSYQWIVAWEDDTTNGGDIYAQNIQLSGALGPVGVGLQGKRDASLKVSVFPNPVTTSSEIILSQPAASEACLEIYNMQGIRVRTLAHQLMGAGLHHFAWKGEDDSGSLVANGIYFLKSASGHNVSVTKVVLNR